MAAKLIIVLVLLKWASAGDIPRIKITKDQNVDTIIDQGNSSAIVNDRAKRRYTCKGAGRRCMLLANCNTQNINLGYTCNSAKQICCITPPPVAPVQFMIIHKLSGYCLNPCAKDGKYWVCTYPAGYGNNYLLWTFESMDKEWGFIRNVHHTNKIFYPGYAIDGTNSVKLEDSSTVDVDTYGYFRIDQVQNKIYQRCGKIIEPSQPGPEICIPKVTSEVKLMPDRVFKRYEPYPFDYAEFIFVDPKDHKQEVLVYGHPFINGVWRLVYSLIDAKVTHIWEHQVRVGKSATASTTDEFKFGFEVAASAKASFFGASVSVTASASLSASIIQSDSSTWNAERTDTRTITVQGGDSVAVWQLVFTAYQHGHTAVHASNIFQDTKSPDIIPPGP